MDAYTLAIMQAVAKATWAKSGEGFNGELNHDGLPALDYDAILASVEHPTPAAYIVPRRYGSELTFTKPEPPQDGDMGDEWYCIPLYRSPLFQLDVRPATWLVERHAFRASPDGQDAEDNSWLEVTEPSTTGAFPVYARAEDNLPQKPVATITVDHAGRASVLQNQLLEGIHDVYAVPVAAEAEIKRYQRLLVAAHMELSKRSEAPRPAQDSAQLLKALKAFEANQATIMGLLQSIGGSIKDAQPHPLQPTQPAQPEAKQDGRGFVIHSCWKCGHTWEHGKSGAHECSDLLYKTKEDLLDILVMATHHEGALAELKSRWAPYVEAELARRWTESDFQANRSKL